MTRDEEWERHYDSTNKWWYRYNRRTGESEWETEAPDDEINESLHDTGGTSGGVELKSRRNAQSQQVEMIKSKEKKKRLLSGSSHEIGTDDTVAATTTMTTTTTRPPLWRTLIGCTRRQREISCVIIDA